MNVHAPLFESKDAEQLDLLNPRAVIGDNNPPADEIEPSAAPADVPAKPQSAAINSARWNYVYVSAFLTETPVIQSVDDANKAANFIEQARKTVQDMEAEWRKQTDPLRVQVDAINADYRLPRESIESLLEELKRRLKTFTDAEEAKRAEEAQLLADMAAQAERIAREAEAAEREAMLEADCGALVDVAGASVHADKTFDAFKRTSRAAQRAGKAIKVKLNGGFDRAVSMRTVETLIVQNATNLQWFSGTTAGTAVSGVMCLTANQGYTIPYMPIANFATLATGVAITLNSSVATTVGGWVTYVAF